jgi:hypothetical protein
MTTRKDNRPVVQIKKCDVGWYSVMYQNEAFASVGYYTRRADAKRGMELFLRRIGADPARVRWEGEE